MVRKIMQKVAETIKANNERGARTALIEDLFQDFNRNRHQVYWMNFIRGIFFGLGSVLGGTIVVALLIWILAHVGNWIPGMHDFFQALTQTLQRPKN